MKVKTKEKYELELTLTEWSLAALTNFIVSDKNLTGEVSETSGWTGQKFARIVEVTVQGDCFKVRLECFAGFRLPKRGCYQKQGWYQVPPKCLEDLFQAIWLGKGDELREE